MSSEILAVQHLNKSFGKKQVLHDISFQIKPGHIVGLIGANGAGKTTIMRTLLGITSFTGKIRLDDQPITVGQHQALTEVGALIEYPGLYPFLTGREQLKLFATGADQKAKVAQVIQQLELSGYIDSRTKGYSLGMKQKLGIALALVNQPKLVILDEPMNGLDPQATKSLRELILAERKKGTTFLISSHILSELQKLADDVLVIDHGHLVRDTTMNELLAANQHYYLIKTDQNDRALKLLTAAGHEVSLQNDGLKLVVNEQTDLNAVLKLVIENQLVIEDIQQQAGDLEESLLDLLADETEQGAAK